jgi:hypothetical protein
MKTTSVPAVLLMMAGAAMQAATLPGGLEFKMPAGWTMKSNETAAVLLPPDMAMEANGKDPAELYIVTIQESIRNLQDPQLISFLTGKFVPAGARATMAGAPAPFRTAAGNGALYVYNAVSEGVTLSMHIYVVELPGNGVAGIAAIARPTLLARREAMVYSVATSLNRTSGAARALPQATAATAPAPATELAAQWDQRLRGRKLYQFGNYSSGYGSGGMASQKTLLLAANGSYQFNRSSSTSIYTGGASASSASQNAAQGRWRIHESGGKVILELVSNTGATENIVLTAQGSKTLLNGNRWMVGD